MPVSSLHYYYKFHNYSDIHSEGRTGGAVEETWEEKEGRELPGKDIKVIQY